MNKEEAEKMLLQAMRIVVAIYHAYSPDGGYITLNYIKDSDGEYINFNTDPDEENMINYHIHLKEG